MYNNRNRTSARALAMLALLLVVALVSTACDPGGPGAAGTVSVAPGIDPASFTTLVLRAFPNPFKTFDPSLPIPGEADQRVGAEEPLARLTFPHPYQVGGGIGGTEVQDWTFVAWLSHQGPGASFTLDPGDVFCTKSFQIEGCSPGGSYCGVTSAIDCTLKDVVVAK